MESHVVARVARRNDRPFAAVRVVSDSSHQSLPPAALVAMASTGRIDVMAVLRSLLSRPAQLPALVRTAWEAEKAFRTLSRCGLALTSAPIPVPAVESPPIAIAAAAGD
jgi:hypothetical protein